MDIVQAILDYESPHNWVKNYSSDYPDSYLLFDVDNDCREYQEVVRSYSSVANEVSYIKRVQNPYQLGLFKIQEEKRNSEGDSTTIVKGYHAISPLDLNIALKYPLDYRRYKQKRGHLQCIGKHPKFYCSLESAYNDCRTELSYEGEIIIMKCDHFSDVKSQGDYVPNYVICLQC